METERIDLGDFSQEYAGGWVEVRTRLSYRQKQIVDNHRQPRVVRDVATGAVREAGLDFLAFGMALLEQSVVAWDGVKDRHGKPLPANRTGYEHDDFDGDLGDWLVDRISAIHEAHRRSPEERKAEPAPSTGS